MEGLSKDFAVPTPQKLQVLGLTLQRLITVDPPEAERLFSQLVDASRSGMPLLALHFRVNQALIDQR